ncbi:MAG: ABC transporter permease [Acidobacteria bacterium]|nr:ABC transporter permease [Acidobacteriota bacterium]
MSVNDNLFVIILASAIFYGTPLVFAALGELLSERSGVINLGVEGMMLLGAVCSAVVAANLDGPAALVLPLALLAGMAAAALGAAIHAFLVITLRVNQIISGLALTIFAGAAGLSSYLANVWGLGRNPSLNQFGRMDLFGLKDVPVVGPILFDQTLLTYLSWLLVGLAMVYLFRTRMGLHLRAVGESPQTADSVGIPVTRYRYGHVIVGGMFAGIAGACYSLTIVPTWANGLTSGAGWIALALVIFGFWRPDLTLVGAYLFGALSSLSFTLQARGIDVPSALLNALPYLATIVVLVLVSNSRLSRRLGSPAALGRPYEREER